MTVTNQEVVVVTGAATGFGRLTAESLARRGYRVVATMRDPDGRNAEARDQLAAIASDEQLALRVSELDVADPAGAEQMVADVLGQEGAIDVLVNNAGYSVHGLMETITDEQAKGLFETNLFGVLRLNRAVLPHMHERGSGLLVHVSSGLGRVVRPLVGMYCASKFALEAAAEAYRYELAHLGIDSIIVEPGVFATEFSSKAAFGSDGERGAIYDDWTRMPPVMRNDRDPQEVADVIVDLIETPAGERPLRTRVGGPETGGPARINEASAEVAQTMFERSGLNYCVAFVDRRASRA
ncbi:MAG TPA: SDR family oxidoreductase [Solirubrobacteraceae bacterium]|jgi:NAD(P)-dependent dehydrogenase (short-subunit alcohol dehydrogenase family)|nr:SDR family oxidoreductase [Solirubrobacteraceae bacterium]